MVLLYNSKYLRKRIFENKNNTFLWVDWLAILWALFKAFFHCQLVGSAMINNYEEVCDNSANIRSLQET